MRKCFGPALRLAALGLLVTSAANAADKFPARPITMIVPFTPGGPVDAQARSLATEAEKVFGVPVIVDNKPGAGGTLGPATMAATARPDGYIIANMQTGMFSVPWMQKVTFDTIKDFTYIIQMTGGRSMIVVRTDSPWKTWKEFAADAKAHPGTIAMGSSGSGGGSHLVGAGVALAADIKLLHIPFRGMSEAFAALLGEHIKVVAPAAGIAKPQIEAGAFRPLLTTLSARNPKFPDVPSLTDEGLVPLVDLSFPQGLAGPKGMAPDVLRILHDGFRKALESPEHQAVIDQLDQAPAYINSADYAAAAAIQLDKHRALVTALGLARKE
jgi:tripartite-type tricarboxylate transporter receptor subunit TctC